jgi:hypothetical protein
MRYAMCMMMFLILGCASIPTLDVTYRLPLTPEKRADKEVFLSVKDKRVQKELIGEGARADYEHFSGLISFYVAKGEGDGSKIGSYDISSTFQEAFKRRLENLGMTVLSEMRRGTIVLDIEVKRFLLDLVDKDWVVMMTYEAKLSKDDQLLYSQTISGQAERLKLVGRGQADTVTSQLFTDVVNQLDVIELMKKADI